MRTQDIHCYSSVTNKQTRTILTVLGLFLFWQEVVLTGNISKEWHKLLTKINQKIAGIAALSTEMLHGNKTDQTLSCQLTVFCGLASGDHFGYSRRGHICSLMVRASRPLSHFNTEFCLLAIE